MSTSDNLRRTKALKKDQVYNWFEKYETKSTASVYVINRNVEKRTVTATNATARKLKRIKNRFKAVAKSKAGFA
ncbi:hypothetical protein MTsDn1_21490 [Alteromonas sp. MTD1]|uniref:hypothetical protein n=1 Tax=Alteromonas sp. MTD1 TaxID=3057962 RepID=UPI0036F1EFA9